MTAASHEMELFQEWCGSREALKDTHRCSRLGPLRAEARGPAGDRRSGLNPAPDLGKRAAAGSQWSMKSPVAAILQGPQARTAGQACAAAARPLAYSGAVFEIFARAPARPRAKAFGFEETSAVGRAELPRARAQATAQLSLASALADSNPEPWADTSAIASEARYRVISLIAAKEPLSGGIALWGHDPDASEARKVAGFYLTPRATPVTESYLESCVSFIYSRSWFKPIELGFSPRS
jgi:hypothetical protein